jgi:hypothetical protein
LPASFGREPDRLAVVELERALTQGQVEPPDAPAEVGDAVTAIRLAAAGAVASGPVLFERLDWRPYAIRPAFPVAAMEPPGDPVRLDAFRARLAGDVLVRLPLADDDPELGEALDRWELSLFQSGPLRSEQLREALTALLGGPDGPWAAAVRASLLLGGSAPARGELLRTLRGLAGGEPASDDCATAVRRALVEVLLHGDRPALLAWLDDALLGVRPGPVGVYARLASNGPSGALAAA